MTRTRLERLERYFNNCSPPPEGRSEDEWWLPITYGDLRFIITQLRRTESERALALVEAVREQRRIWGDALLTDALRKALDDLETT